jgi:hypothetical protein
MKKLHPKSAIIMKVLSKLIKIAYRESIDRYAPYIQQWVIVRTRFNQPISATNTRLNTATARPAPHASPTDSGAHVAH